MENLEEKLKEILEDYENKGMIQKPYTIEINKDGKIIIHLIQTIDKVNLSINLEG